MVYSVDFGDKFYGQILESSENTSIKALLYKREISIKGSTLKLVARTYAKDLMEAKGLLDLFVELKEALE